MTKLAGLSGFDRAPQADAVISVPQLRTRFYAFLSYSHNDRILAGWLHKELEKFRVPHSLAGKLTATGVVPRRLTPIFRDQHDLSAGGDLAEEIKATLAASQFLVVLCSPAAANSRWTNEEIESFKRTRPENCVIAAVVDGEPFASDIPGREAEECFPPALRYRYDRRGHRTTKRADPLAADFRQGGEGRRLAFLKLAAGMLGVGLDELVHREQTRHQRNLAYVAAASLAGMAVTSALATSAFQARNAATQERRQAEGLVEFMLGNLKDKLEPVGKLDVLDGVGSRVLDYYSRQDTKQLSDVGLAQRSKALTLMGQISRDRGDLDRANALYSRAYAVTAEQVGRNPHDPQLLFNHAQNVFYLGEVAFKRGELDKAERDFREYRDLATRMVALDPENMRWRMEEQDAAANLGSMLYNRRDFAGAVGEFRNALSTIEALASADPTNATYQQNISDTLALLAPAQEANGELSEATDTQKRYVALLQQLVSRQGADAEFRLIVGHRELGRLYAEQGRGDQAIEELNAAVQQGDRLLSIEPGNAKWLESTEAAKLLLARQYFDQGSNQDLGAQLQAICSTFSGLTAKDSKVALRSANLRNCLLLSAQVAERSGQKEKAAGLAALGVEHARSVKTLDRISDAFGVAGALRVLGDVRKSSGNLIGAQSAWADALAVLPKGVTEKPSEMDERARIAERVGENGQSLALIDRLERTGYRRIELKSN